MKMYCNARLPVGSQAHKLRSEDRTEKLEQWLQASSDNEILEHANRVTRGAKNGRSVSVAIGLSATQSERLSRLLDGRWKTFSALVRNVFKE